MSKNVVPFHKRKDRIVVSTPYNVESSGCICANGVLQLSLTMWHCSSTLRVYIVALNGLGSIGK